MKKRILAVDDEPMVLTVIRKRLEFAGFEVITAEDGMEGLRLARTEQPDLIVLDLILPGINGYQICGMLKRDQNLKRIPILMLSARSQEHDVSEGLRLGADAYMTKPYETEEFMAQVQTLLAKAEAEKPVPPPAPSGDAAPR